MMFKVYSDIFGEIKPEHITKIHFKDGDIYQVDIEIHCTDGTIHNESLCRYEDRIFYISRFTGVYDKYLDPIYEGDILCNMYGQDDFFVFYEAPSFVLKRIEKGYTGFRYKWAELIDKKGSYITGNIFKEKLK
jgi:hypothetical protein